MPVIVGLLAILGGAAFWYWRLQQARDAAETLAEAAQEVRFAPRRFGFRRKVNVHPAESIDDPRLAALSIVTAMAQMDEAWGREMSQSLTLQTQSIFGVRRAEAEEMVVFAKWMSDQSSTYAEIVRRLSKRLASLADEDIRVNLGLLISRVCETRDGDFSEDVSDALATVNRHLR